MGYPYAPHLANIYILEFDEKIMNGFHIKPKFYFRFLDDIFFIWPGTEEELGEFGRYINSLIPDITVTLNHHHGSILFLDTIIFKKTRPNHTEYHPTDAGLFQTNRHTPTPTRQILPSQPHTHRNTKITTYTVQTPLIFYCLAIRRIDDD